MELHWIASKDVHRYELIAIPLIQRILEHAHGAYNAQDILKDIKEEFKQLWIVTNEDELKSIVITEIITYPQSKILCIMGCSGSDLDEWLFLIERIKSWGLDQGCDACEIYGRRGWIKKLSEHGFSLSHVILRSPLCHSEAKKLPKPPPQALKLKDLSTKVSKP